MNTYIYVSYIYTIHQTDSLNLCYLGMLIHQRSTNGKLRMKKTFFCTKQDVAPKWCVHSVNRVCDYDKLELSAQVGSSAYKSWAELG